MEQLEQLVSEHQDALFRFAFIRTGSRTDAEDIVQEALLKFATKRTPVANPKAYLFRMVANRCCDRHRRMQCSQPLDDCITATEQHSSTTETIAASIFALITKGLRFSLSAKP